MILIPEHPIFARNAQGQKCSFDLRRFNDELREAFQRNGIQDSWLVEQFALSIEEKLRTETMHSTPLSENEIDTLLTSVLTASGYSEVANSYAEIHGVNPMRGILAGLASWNDARLADTLTKRLPLTARQVAKLVPLCHEALTQLHLSQISDTFIVELAAHLAHADNAVPDEKRVPQPGERPHVRTPEQLSEAADDFTRRLIAEKVLRILPVTEMFPRAQVSLSLQEYCRVFTGTWTSELAIAAGMGPVARAILDVLTAYRLEIADVYPNLADSSSTVFMAHYAEFIEQSVGKAAKAEQIAFDQALQQLLKRHLTDQAGFNLQIRFEKNAH